MTLRLSVKQTKGWLGSSKNVKLNWGLSWLIINR